MLWINQTCILLLDAMLLLDGNLKFDILVQTSLFILIFNLFPLFFPHEFTDYFGKIEWYFWIQLTLFLGLHWPFRFYIKKKWGAKQPVYNVQVVWIHSCWNVCIKTNKQTNKHKNQKKKYKQNLFDIKMLINHTHM